MFVGGVCNVFDWVMWQLVVGMWCQFLYEFVYLFWLQFVFIMVILGLDSVFCMVEVVLVYFMVCLFKFKLEGMLEDVECVVVVCWEWLDVCLVIDVNEGWIMEYFEYMMGMLLIYCVDLIEQLLFVGCDVELVQYQLFILLVVDELLQMLDDFDIVVKCYCVVNIKLDKCGGLSVVFIFVSVVCQCGMQVMIGCMGGCLMVILFVFIVVQMVDFVDLDGFLIVVQDSEFLVCYVNGCVSFDVDELFVLVWFVVLVSVWV